eukprot:SAG31_NODE_1495_length_8102_cov_5.708021_6_plen_101_part_00
MLMVVSVMLILVVGPFTHPLQMIMVQIKYLRKRSKGTSTGNVYVVEVQTGSGVGRWELDEPLDASSEPFAPARHQMDSDDTGIERLCVARLGITCAPKDF